MRILAINSDLDEAWRAQGHEVHAVALEAGVHSARELVRAAPFVPEVLFQKEHLGQRVLLADLEEVEATKAFWSVDTHLNLYWQRHYARLFDVLLTPHKAFLSEMTAPHPQVHRLAACAPARPFVPHAARSRAMAFVGRLSGVRPLRRHLCALLDARYGVRAHDGLPFADMLALYADTRLLPNESIAMETNFRLLEGAACGCCVLSQNLGEDQDALLTPGQEVLVYEDALDFVELADACLADPHLTERVGRAAWEKVQQAHLPCHRASCAAQVLASAPHAALQGREARDVFFMTLGQMALGGALPKTNVQIALAHLEDPWRRCQLQLMQGLAAGEQDSVRQRLHEAEQALAEQAPVAPVAPVAPSAPLADLAVVAGGASLLLHEREQALRWLHVWHENTFSELASPLPHKATPDTVHADWIEALSHAGRRATHGFQYRMGCCQSALDMILLLAEQDGTGSGWANHLLQDDHLRRIHPHLAMAAQVRLALNSPDEPERGLASLAAMLRLFDLAQARSEYRHLESLAQTHPVLGKVLKKRFGRLESLGLLTPAHGAQSC